MTEPTPDTLTQRLERGLGRQRAAQPRLLLPLPDHGLLDPRDALTPQRLRHTLRGGGAGHARHLTRPEDTRWERTADRRCARRT